MKAIFFSLALATTLIVPANAETAKVCTCKCVTKESDNTLAVVKGSGKDREAAGESLKKNLKKKKCELSPDCTGSC